MKVLVIGAGASGLPALRWISTYGHDVVCFEKSTKIGGLWDFKDTDKEDEASVMKSTIINTSKEMMAYSDFPPPKEYSNFMHNSKVLEYLHAYANKFNLMRFIKFEHRVNRVERTLDFGTSKQFKVLYQNDSGEHEDTFDAVFLCTGHHVSAYAPKFPGLDKFKGRVLHTHSLKRGSEFQDKNVLIIGIGNSGGDAAVEIARSAKMTYLSTRRGSWVVNRVSDYGWPADLRSSRLFQFLLENAAWLVNWIGENRLNERFDHELYGLKPKHRLNAQHPMVNDDMPNRIAAGTLQIRPNVAEFTESGVIFDDGQRIDDLDVVILATGYTFGFPYLEDGLIPVKDNRVRLYRFMYSPYVEHPERLIVVGCIQPLGAIFPISEMQCRVACEVLAGNTQLPTKDEMNAEIDATVAAMSKQYVESRRHTIQVNYVGFMDQLASMIGARPDVKDWHLWLRDFKLAWALAFGPTYPYHFRLQGPHPWSEARDTIFSADERIRYPLQYTRKLDAESSKFSELASLMKFVILIFVVYLLFNMVF